MEFMLGSLFTLVVVTIVGKLISKQQQVSNRFFKPNFSQSYTNELIKHNMVVDYLNKKNVIENNQSFKYFKEKATKIISMDGVAYWIENNTLYQAMIRHQKIMKNTKKKVDTHSMDSVELDKIQFIVSKLTEGKGYDSGNTGH